MRVLHVTHSLTGGGAGVAARRIFEATRTQPGIDAHLIATSPLPAGLTDPRIAYFRPRNRRLNALAESAGLRIQKSINPAHRTVGLFSSGLADQIFQGDWDLVHFHWLGLGTLSIKEIGKISQTIPSVWTLHDSWPFCGAEHHPHFERDTRFESGYTSQSRLLGDSRYDIDASVFRAKQRSWHSPISLVAPTVFMAKNAKASTLTKEWPVTTIPHPIDTATFNPKLRNQRIKTLTSAGLDPTRPVVLFVASPGSDFNKGLDLLQVAFRQIHRRRPDAQLVTIGGPWLQLSSETTQVPGQRDEKQLANWYSAADVLLVPSRIESFSLVAAEAQACGTPVIAFETSGLVDVLAGQPADTLVPRWDAISMGTRATGLLDSLNLDRSEEHDDSIRIWTPHSVGESYAEWYGRSRESHGTNAG